MKTSTVIKKHFVELESTNDHLVLTIEFHKACIEVTAQDRVSLLVNLQDYIDRKEDLYIRISKWINSYLEKTPPSLSPNCKVHR